MIPLIRTRKRSQVRKNKSTSFLKDNLCLGELHDEKTIYEESGEDT